MEDFLNTDFKTISDENLRRRDFFTSHLRLAATSIENLPSSREFSLVKTKLEEAVMWFTKGLTKGE